MGIGVCDHRALTTSYERVSMKLVEQGKVGRRKDLEGRMGFFFSLEGGKASERW